MAPMSFFQGFKPTDKTFLVYKCFLPFIIIIKMRVAWSICIICFYALYRHLFLTCKWANQMPALLTASIYVIAILIYRSNFLSFLTIANNKTWYPSRPRIFPLENELFSNNHEAGQYKQTALSVQAISYPRMAILYRKSRFKICFNS